MEERRCTLLYEEDGELVFADDNMTQFEVATRSLGPHITDFVRPHQDYTLQLYREDQVVSLLLPESVVLQVVETEPNPGKQATKTMAFKPAILQTGKRVMVPPFVEEGDEILVRTKDGEYVGRA